ncbi:site-specific integrase [Parashewanella curva]|uniref:Site-specific integrase n=1 Tax=Parashewanella curva TaxID=2338552 RepID=A0A3L8PTM4_9GAMM|nr:tyrosine-type recombinase/integrase [Parashewanella curva]RLV57758.1 site-specific integrase [Parashewanella curva]
MAKQLERHTISDDLYIFQQDNSSRWYARLQVGGKWRCKATKEKDKDKAIIKATRLLVEYQIRSESGSLITSKKFAIIAEQAIAKMQKQLEDGLGKKSFVDYIQALNKYHIPFFGQIYITTIDASKLREFDEWRTIKSKKVPAKSTIQNHNAAMQMVYKEAVENKWLLPSQVPVLSNNGTSSQRRAAFSPDEFERVYEAIREMEGESRTSKSRQILELLGDYICFAVCTGMRPGSELDNLTWGDIHIEAKGYQAYFCITVRQGKTTQHTGVREVVCKDGIKHTLQDLTKRFPTRYKDEKLFRLADGTTTKELGKAFDRALIKTGLKESRQGTRSLYSLRHSYITWELLAKTAPIDVIAKQCGTSVEMIEKHYSHVTPRMFGKELSGVDISNVHSEAHSSSNEISELRKIMWENLFEKWERNYREKGCI